MCYRHSIEPLEDQRHANSPESTSTLSNNDKIFKLSEKIKCINKSFGSGFHHKIQFGTSLTTEMKPGSQPISELLKDQDNLTMNSKLITLEFAYMCLRNALKLLPTTKEIIFLITGIFK